MGKLAVEVELTDRPKVPGGKLACVSSSSPLLDRSLAEPRLRRLAGLGRAKPPDMPKADGGPVLCRCRPNRGGGARSDAFESVFFLGPLR